MADTHKAHSEAVGKSNEETLLAVTIVTPTGTRAEYNVHHLRAPGIDGDFGVLPGHIPFITALKVGAVTFDQGSAIKFWAVSGGFAEVLDNKVTILAENAEPAESIDVERAEAARQRALQRVRDHDNLQNYDAKRASSALARAINRINIASHS